MKTTTEIQNEINSILEQDVEQLTDKQIKKNHKRVEFLKYCLRYLETNPTKEFLASEKSRVKGLVSKITERYGQWCKDIAPKDVDPKKWKPLFNKETGITKLNKQLKTLTFLA